jgi:hypothetical protein
MTGSMLIDDTTIHALIDQEAKLSGQRPSGMG